MTPRTLAAAVLLTLALLSPGGVPASADPLACTLCGSGIAGRYTVYEELGWSVCSECSREPACAGCGLPRAGRLAAGEGEHCARCVAHADGCAGCGRPILERYWTIAGTAGKFCPRCHADAPRCTVCRAPARAGQALEGRIYCRSCHPRLVTEAERCHTLYEELAVKAERRLGLSISRLPELVVEGKDALAARPSPASGHEGICGLYVRDARGRASIHVLSHLTEARTTAVIAHELAHAWQSESCPDAQGTRIREGFAEWVSWKLLEGTEGGVAERELIESRTDEYGVGFRIFADLEARFGAERAVWYARVVRRE